MTDADDGSVAVDFDADGLVPVVAQDVDTGEVLMLAYATREALERTLDTGRAHYYSRSRDQLWEKGATSGHTQSVEAVRVDCDADTVLYLVDQTGGACHTGHRSCFYRRVEAVDGDERAADGAAGASQGSLELDTETVGEPVFDPDEVY
jgi:phosphoribosyl-AMP cyclohydrolase